MPKSNMPKHAERRKMPEGPHHCMQMTNFTCPVPLVPRLPRKTTVDVSLCHACHAKRPWMCNCATPATWNQGGCHQLPRLPRRSGAASRASRAPKPRPSAPPSAVCTTPATQNDRGCAIVPRLPREIKVDVTKCHACEIIVCLVCVCVKLVWN